jgi:hypothetical protein
MLSRELLELCKHSKHWRMLKSFIFFLHAKLWLLLPSFMLASYLAYSSTLFVEETYYSEMSVDLQRTTRCYISEGRTLHNYRCKNFKSCSIQYCAQIPLPSMAQAVANHSLAQDVIILNCLFEPWLGLQLFRLGFTSGQHSFLPSPSHFTVYNHHLMSQVLWITSAADKTS